jgi:thiamine pyrophosphate-dependent acetolactate synthase large subunit-like protein/rubredoxin
MGKFRCTVCNWVYDEDIQKQKFSDEVDIFTCPVCGAPKSAFVPEGITKSDESIETSVADKIIEQLESLGVEYIYGIPGSSNLPLIDAIRKRNTIKFILTRHEETAAFMASAHGKMTDRLGVCISIAGPGCTNLMTGLADAATDKSPVLALTGQVPEVYLGSEAFQEIEQLELFRSFAEYTETVARTNQALKLVLMAAKYAYKKPGVSVLSTPTDVLAEKLDEPIYSRDKRVFIKESLPEDTELEKAAKLINETKNIAVLAGWGSRHAGNLLLELAEKIKSPIATTSRSKGVIDETYHYSLGVLGSIGSKHAAYAIQHFDLLILIGTGFRQANLLPPGIKIIQIDMDSTRVGKTANVEVGLVGDAPLTLKKLIPLLHEKEEDIELKDTLASIKQEHLDELKADAEDYSVPISPGFIIQSLKRNVHNDAIICVDVGDHTYWFYKKFICDGQKTFMSANIASMGFGLPASLSAKLDYPDKQVICITGDGGFGMVMADFTTAVRENLAIKVIVFNDGKLKNIKKEQESEHFPEFGVNFPNPDFAGFATSCGGEGYTVEDPHKLDEVLNKAFRSDKPSLIDIIVDPSKMAPSTKQV